MLIPIEIKSYVTACRNRATNPNITERVKVHPDSQGYRYPPSDSSRSTHTRRPSS
jgi:hypothetical protein